jgi:hypothetical protein
MPKSEFVKRSNLRQEKYFKELGKTMEEGWIMSGMLENKEEGGPWEDGKDGGLNSWEKLNLKTADNALNGFEHLDEGEGFTLDSNFDTIVA